MGPWEGQIMSLAEKSADARDCPSVEQVYERIIREHLGRSPLEGVTDEQFVKQIVKRFRKAPMVLCSRCIGTWINTKLEEMHWTQQEFADLIEVDRSTVAYWTQGGNITLDNLALVLIGFKSEWSDLEIPARQEMAVAAYGAALTFIREALGGEQPVKPLDGERFWCLYHLFSQPHWARALRLQDTYLLGQEARRIAHAVESSLKKKPHAALSVKYLQTLVADWGRAWLVCVAKVPRLATQ
jgi:transcriptional regulator with XRE-family HTH domain